LKNRVANRDQPFFLYLPYNAPHFPIQPPQEWLARTKQEFPDLTPARAANVAFVQHLDDNLGKLFSALDDPKLGDNTVVAFTSDNGGSLRHAQRNLPWRDGKQSHYDGGLRVPFLIRPTDKSLAGTTCDYVGMTFDLTATFLDLAGAKRDGDTDAVSLAPVLSGKPMPEPANPRQLYFVRREGGNAYMGLAYHALIRGKWKLMRNSPFAPLELFDLHSDPQETSDVIDKNPKVANEMKRLLREHVQRGGRVPWQSELDSLP
jgi:arylsulfatase A-like enzyme